MYQIPFRRKNEADRRLGAASRRIKKLVGREDIKTDDPLMAEIQLAQLDAMLGIGYLLSSLQARIAVEVDTRAYGYAIRDLNLDTRKLSGDLEDIKGLVYEMYRKWPVDAQEPTEPLSKREPSWWERLLGRG